MATSIEKRVVLGTAGLIDHGKTSLVRALTGIDTDLLKEEKERGITIELGFAHLGLPSGIDLAIVDVPGHERFVKNMVAGASGIDLVLLVVAADEGAMPQTREHLDICSLLRVKAGLVALTKTDMVDDDLRELAREDVRALVEGTFLEGAPIVPVSSTTGQGLEELCGLPRLGPEHHREVPGLVSPEERSSPLHVDVRGLHQELRLALPPFDAGPRALEPAGPPPESSGNARTLQPLCE